MPACNAIIVGTGGHAQVVWATWKAAREQCADFPVEVVGWLESVNWEGPDTTLGLPVFRETIEGWTALHARQIRHFYIGIGMVKAAPQRWNIVNRLIQQGLEPLTLLHPSAIISPQADIEAGAFVGAGAIIQPFAKIGQAAIINSGAIVEHHVQIGCNSHVTPGTILCGESRVGEHAMLGAGSVVIQQKAIGDLVTIGAGSVVTEDIPARATAVGSPARILMPSSRSLGD